MIWVSTDITSHMDKSMQNPVSSLQIQVLFSLESLASLFWCVEKSLTNWDPVLCSEMSREEGTPSTDSQSETSIILTDQSEPSIHWQHWQHMMSGKWCADLSPILTINPAFISTGFSSQNKYALLDLTFDNPKSQAKRYSHKTKSWIYD